MRERVHHPAGIRELLQLLKVPRDERATFKRHVNALVASGDLIQIRGQRFGLPEKMDLYVGRLQTHPAGYGFVIPERPLDGGGDIYISGPLLNEAMHGDRVVARIERIKDGGRVEGRIIRILERSNTWIVGRYDRAEDGMGYVVPFDRRVLMDIFVPPGQEGGASPGEMVLVELTRWPTSTRGAIGRVAEVLGDIDAPGVDTEIIIRKYGIPDAHSAEAVAEAVKLGDAVSERDIRGRTDFRDLADRDDRRRTRSRLRRRDHHREAAERALLARRAHRRRLALRRRGQRARSRGLRARDLGLLSRARRAHVSFRACDRPVQPEPARRSTGAVVPDGNRSAGRGRASRAARRRHQQ